MNIPNFTNIDGNYVLNPSQVGNLRKKGITNQMQVGYNSQYGLEPVYVLKKQDLAVNHKIEGEGGLGSGKELAERFPNASNAELEVRRRQQIKNAQRKYRSNNRDAYNDYMKKLYEKMANDKQFISGEPSKRFAKTTNEGKDLPYSDPKTWYEYRLEQARVANEKYRSKKKAERVIANLDNIIDKDLKELFKKENKGKRGRPKQGQKKAVFDPDSEWYKTNFEMMKISRQKELEETGTIVPYKDRQKVEKPDKLNYDDIPDSDKAEYNADPKAYWKKREKPKAPPVVSSKKKNPFQPKENITMSISEDGEPTSVFEPTPVEEAGDTAEIKLLKKYFKEHKDENTTGLLASMKDKPGKKGNAKRDMFMGSNKFKAWLASKK
jgi:hypothetical protein